MAVMRSGWDGMERGKKREPGGLEGAVVSACVTGWAAWQVDRTVERPGQTARESPCISYPVRTVPTASRRGRATGTVRWQATGWLPTATVGS